MILFLLQIYFNIFKKVFPLNNTIKRTFSALSWTSFSHCGKFSPKLKCVEQGGSQENSRLTRLLVYANLLVSNRQQTGSDGC